MNESTESPKVSVIIPVWNGRQYLPACLDALLAQTYPHFEVIAVDNASRDGSADWLAENYLQVRLVRNSDNLGFAGGCNAGLAAAQGDILVLLNQDTRVHTGWLDALVGALQEPRTGIAGCKSLYPDGQTIQHAGGWIDWPSGLSHHHGVGEQDTGQWDVPRQVEYVTGAAMAFRRDLLDRIGPLDDGFWPGYYEDVDFCFAARNAGYEVWYIPEDALTHVETTSLTDERTISQITHRGRLRFLLKHMSPQRFVAEFMPVERARHQRTAQGWGRHTRRMAYLESIPVAATLLARHWRADAATIDRVLAALQQLCMVPVSESIPFSPTFDEFVFPSAVPVIGPLIARLRSVWYGIAARWAVRYLAQQQAAINQRQEEINQWQERINQLYARSLVSLSREVAHTILRLEPDEEYGHGDEAGGT